MYRLIVSLLQPYPLMLLLIWLTLANLWRKRQETRRRLLFLMLPLLVLTLMSLPVIGWLVAGTLEWQYPPVNELPQDVQALVVLGGAVIPADESHEQPQLTPDSMYRCLHALDLYRRRPCLIVVSGGKVDPDQPGPPVAEVMADFLRGMGVNPAHLVVENGSRSTFENAVQTCLLLEQRQVRKIALVTEAMHMVRSEGCFRKQGLEVVPSACSYVTPRLRLNFYSFVPTPESAGDCQRVGHEWLGIVWYWINGRL